MAFSASFPRRQGKVWLSNSCLNLQTVKFITYFVNSQSVKENVPFHKVQVPKLQHLQGNLQGSWVYSKWRKHCYELCVWRCSKSLPDKKEDVWSIQYIMHGSLYACSCDEEWYFGVANCFSVENVDVTIKFLQINGPATQFFRPSLEDTCWIPIHDIITKVDPSSFGSSWFYCFDCDEMTL